MPHSARRSHRRTANRQGLSWVSIVPGPISSGGVLYLKSMSLSPFLFPQHLYRYRDGVDLVVVDTTGE